MAEYEYQFSKPVPRHLYEHLDYFSMFEPRIHIDADNAQKAALACHDEMAAGRFDNVKAHLAQAFLSIDEVGSQRFLKKLNHWGEVTGEPYSMLSNDTYVSFEEYTAHRLLDGGIPVYRQMFMFGSGISLNEEEERLMKQLCAPELTALILSNDYFSWDKEYQEYLTNPALPPDSSIFYFMKRDSLSPSEAKAEVKRRIMALEKEYCEGKAAYLAAGNPNPKIVQSFTIVELGMAGCMLFSMTAPRYNEPTPSSGLCEGTVNKVMGCWAALVFCEAFPDRICAFSYAGEFAFLWDDVQESIKQSPAALATAGPYSEKTPMVKVNEVYSDSEEIAVR